MTLSKLVGSAPTQNAAAAWLLLPPPGGRDSFIFDAGFNSGDFSRENV